MSAPVEFRLYATKFSLQDLKSGRQFILDEKREPYNVAALQFRYKQRLVIAGKPELEWSEWEYIPFVKEADAEQATAKADAPPAA